MRLQHDCYDVSEREKDWFSVTTKAECGDWADLLGSHVLFCHDDDGTMVRGSRFEADDTHSLASPSQRRAPASSADNNAAHSLTHAFPSPEAGCGQGG